MNDVWQHRSQAVWTTNQVSSNLARPNIVPRIVNLHFAVPTYIFNSIQNVLFYL